MHAFILMSLEIREMESLKKNEYERNMSVKWERQCVYLNILYDLSD